MKLRAEKFTGPESAGTKEAYPEIDPNLAEGEYIVAVNTHITGKDCQMSHWRMIATVWIATP